MSPAAWTRDTLVLEGRAVRLEPLVPDHVPALAETGLDPALWTWTVSMVRTEADMRRYVEAALAARAAGTAYPFATVERASGRVVGTTRYCAIEPEHRRVEIGYTFVAPAYQRTMVNTEAKYLMLQHAFDVLNLNRVEFKTDVLNAKSRNALLGIGATEEGVLRAHVITETGRVRDTIYFSILSGEWRRVRAHLEARMRRTADQVRRA